MSETGKFTERINEALNLTSKKRHLKPFYTEIPFHILKQAVSEFINNTNLNGVALRALYYKVISIDHVLPADILREIISYQGLNDNAKFVNRQWNQLSHSIRATLYAQMDQHENKYGLPYNHKTNTTHIISTERNQLTEVEKERGYKMGQVSRVSTTEHVIDFKGSISGDRFFIYPGVYKIKNYYLVLIRKNLSLIGVSSSNNHHQLYGLNSSIHIYVDLGMEIHKSRFRILRCSIETRNAGIHVGSNSSLDVIQSSLKCGQYHSAIRIEDCYSQVNIQQTVIDSAKHGIQLMKMSRDSINEGTKLICKDNVFAGIKSYVIVHRPTVISIDDPDYKWWPFNDKDYEFYLNDDQKCESYEITGNNWRFSRKGTYNVKRNHNGIWIPKSIH